MYSMSWVHLCKTYQILYIGVLANKQNKNQVYPNDTKSFKNDLWIDHVFRKTAIVGNLAGCQKPYTHSKSMGIFWRQKLVLAKNGFLEKIETWHVRLSCQYTHSISFSSKSEHDIVADQATLNIKKEFYYRGLSYSQADPARIQWWWRQWVEY